MHGKRKKRVSSRKGREEKWAKEEGDREEI